MEVQRITLDIYIIKEIETEGAINPVFGQDL
jgi:hypothetical protein